MYELKPFRFWCQKVLPLVYDDSLSYYELLCKVVDYVNKILGNENELAEAMAALQKYVTDFVDSEVEPLVEAKLDEMVEDGEFDRIIARLEVIDYVTPEMFGAVGNGEADDTEAFQAAIDSGYNVCLLMSSRYKLTDTVVLRSVPLVNYEGNRQSRTVFSKAQTMYNNPNSSIVCAFSDATHPVFSIETDAWTFKNVNINGRNIANNSTIELTIFQVNRGGVADVDFHLLNSVVSNVAKLFDFTGRGLLISNCRFTHVNTVADIKWAGDTGGSYHNDVTGQRAVVIRDNRFHSLAVGPFIRTAAEANAFGLELTGNNFDRGHCDLLECNGPVRNWIISNNHFTGMRGYSTTPSAGTNGLMHFLNGVDGLLITGNAFYQVPSVREGIFNNIVVLDANTSVNGLVMTDNTLNMAISGGLIYNLGATMTGCVIANNSIIELSEYIDPETGQPGVSIAPRAILRTRSVTMNTCVMSNNSVGTVTEDVDSVYAIYYVGGITMNNCKVIGNVIPAAHDTIDGTGTANITNSLLDDDLGT